MRIMAVIVFEVDCGFILLFWQSIKRNALWWSNVIRYRNTFLKTMKQGFSLNKSAQSGRARYIGGHKGKKMDGLRPARPNCFRRLVRWMLNCDYWNGMDCVTRNVHVSSSLVQARLQTLAKFMNSPYLWLLRKVVPDLLLCASISFKYHTTLVCTWKMESYRKLTIGN